MDMENENKQKKKFNFIVIYIIGFIISIIFEFYWINYYPYDYFMLFGIGIILCILGYLSIDGVLDMVHQTLQKRDEQNEIMIKASKAIYLTTKRIAMDGTPSLTERTEGDEGARNINSLVQDLAVANERLAREVEYAVSIQSLVKNNEKLVQNVQAAMQEVPQSAPEVDILQSEPETEVPQSVSEVDILQSEPEIEVPQSVSEVDILQNEPEIEVPQNEPEVEVPQESQKPEPSPEHESGEHETPQYAEHLFVEHAHHEIVPEVVSDESIISELNIPEIVVETEDTTPPPTDITENTNETITETQNHTEDAMISEIESNLKATYDMPVENSLTPDAKSPENNDADNQQLTADEIAALFANL